MGTVVNREWLRISEVQELLGIGSTKAYELVSTGELPAVRVGRSLRVRKSEIDAWAERNLYIETRK